MSAQWSRREFLEFLGKSTVMVSTASLLPQIFAGCRTGPKSGKASSPFPFEFLSPTNADDLKTITGIESEILIKWQDVIADHKKKNPITFGNNNDYLAYLPFDPKNPTDGILMVNHEYVHPLFLGTIPSIKGAGKTKEQVHREMDSVGTSLLRLHQESGKWKIDFHSPENRRYTGATPIPLISQKPIEGSRTAIGTFANCAGGVTPWRTFLTCEENYHHYYGEWDYEKNERKLSDRDLGWLKQYDRHPSHYGWVVEINPWNRKAKKLTALGRFAHEGATCVKAKDGRTVVYMGDDSQDQCLYKFISAKPDSLEQGTLFVAQIETGKWLPITLESHPDFKKKFKDSTQLMVRTREAAAMLGGTPLDRPEDIEINPANSDIIVALTNNSRAGRPHGSLLKVTEKNADFLSLEFTAQTWIAGGPESGLSSPDNLVFDKSGNLWVTSDRPDGKKRDKSYEVFGNNGLYYIPMSGPQAGAVFQVASGPNDCELTGPFFTPDGETLLICVQHPGEMTRDLSNPTSNWPDGPGKMPKSSVVALSGPTLKALVNYRG